MPGVNSDGKPVASYGYDIGGKVEKIGGSERGDKMPPSGQLGKLHDLNTDRFYERKGNSDGPSATISKTGYESKAFTSYGCVKSAPKTDVKFLEGDGSWAPAEGRGSGNTGNVPKRGVYSKTITK